MINCSSEFHPAAEAERLRIPEDVGYVSLNVRDDISGATGIDPRGDVMGEIAMDTLGRLLQRGLRSASGNSSVGSLVVGTWCEGRTLLGWAALRRAFDSSTVPPSRRPA